MRACFLLFSALILLGIRASPSHAQEPPSRYEVIYKTSVHSEPNEHSLKVARIEAGTRVSVIGIQGDWLEIRSKHGRPPGFIKKVSAIPVGVGRLPQARSEPVSEAAKVKSSAITYADIKKSSVEMTTAQFKSYVESLRGKEMEGEGRIGDVREKLPIPPWKSTTNVLQAYVFMVSDLPIKRSMAPGTADVILELPTSTALELKIGQFVKFRGQIQSVHNKGGSCCQIMLIDVDLSGTQ